MQKDDVIYRQATIDALKEKVFHEFTDEFYGAMQVLYEMPPAQPKKQTSDEIYGMMKDYYFKHRNEHDESWQSGFAKCMNLIPNMYERREDDRTVETGDTAERKRGKWIISSDGYYPYCSECKSEPKSGDMPDFCPSCGADMRGMKDG